MLGAHMSDDRLPKPRRVLVVANPIAGRGRGARAAEALARGFAARGVACEVLETGGPELTPRRVAAAEPADVVVAVGGDGTLGEVLLGLAERRAPVALVPCGTANVLAKALGLPEDPERALEVVLGGRTRALDVARVGTRLAHIAVSAGFDARVVHEVAARRRGPLTKAAYLGAALRAGPWRRAVPLRVRLDDEDAVHTAGMVWVANTKSYADLLRLAPGTSLDDGLWEVYLFPRASLGELAAAFVRGLASSLPGGPVAMRRARRVRIEADEPVACQVDGEAFGTTPLELELLAQRFRLLVP
jgi:YegS/Rv2252/BmrU family lipid kinase